MHGGDLDFWRRIGQCRPGLHVGPLSPIIGISFHPNPMVVTSPLSPPRTTCQGPWPSTSSKDLRTSKDAAQQGLWDFFPHAPEVVERNRVTGGKSIRSLVGF